MALQDLRHPYVCGYKEFFVTWDKEVIITKEALKIDEELIKRIV